LPVLKICEEAQWKDWTDRDENGQPKTKTGLKWVICKDEGGADDGHGFDRESPSDSGHFRSEYVLVARKQEYLPPHANKLTEKRMAEYKELGALAMTFSPEQDEAYTKFGLKILPHRKDMPFSSSIDFYGPESYNDSKINRVQRNGRSIMDNYGYVLPPGFRIWTDDYSNVLSVFRW
jgi:hypothetical protein